MPVVKVVIFDRVVRSPVEIKRICRNWDKRNWVNMMWFVILLMTTPLWVGRQHGGQHMGTLGPQNLSRTLQRQPAFACVHGWQTKIAIYLPRSLPSSVSHIPELAQTSTSKIAFHSSALWCPLTKWDLMLTEWSSLKSKMEGKSESCKVLTKRTGDSQGSQDAHTFVSNSILWDTQMNTWLSSPAKLLVGMAYARSEGLRLSGTLCLF
jgi:hypothetical protein